MTAVACSTRFQISFIPIPVFAEDITTDSPPSDSEMTRCCMNLWLLDNLSDLVATTIRGIFSLSNQCKSWRSDWVGGILESIS